MCSLRPAYLNVDGGMKNAMQQMLHMRVKKQRGRRKTFPSKSIINIEELTSSGGDEANRCIYSSFSTSDSGGR
jgi:hypothetical protein